MKHRNNIIILSFIVFSLLHFKTIAQIQEKTAAFILKGNVAYEKKPLKDVLFELTKNNEEIIKLNSSGTGKFSIKILQDTTDINSSYILTISKTGFVTKILDINTYIPSADYDNNPFVYTLDVELVATNITNFVTKRPFGKIKWDSTQQLYVIDEIYYRTIFKEEQLLKNNPDKYLLEMITKQNEEKTLKVADGNKELYILKKEKDSVVAVDEDSILIVKQDIPKKKEVHKNNSIKPNKILMATKKNTPSSIKRFNSDQDLFDAALLIEMKKQRKQLENFKIKMNNNRAENIATKYETSNTLTSLMDVVDVYDKANNK